MSSRELPCLCSKMKADAPQPKHQRNRPTEEQRGLWVSVILISSLTPLEKSWVPLGQTSSCENNAQLSHDQLTMNEPLRLIFLFFFLSHKHSNDKQIPLWLIKPAVKVNVNHHTHMKGGVNTSMLILSNHLQSKDKGGFQELQHLLHVIISNLVW